MILPAQTIRRLKILTPCAERTRLNGVTFGLGPASYDLRIANDIRLWPGHSVLVDAIEHFNMPNDVQGKLYMKSTWARMHIRQAGTLIDPGWRGVLRLEIDMMSGIDEYTWISGQYPVRNPGYAAMNPLTIPAGTGVVMVEFSRLEEPTEQPYKGKYQNQKPNQDAIFEREK